MALLLKRTQCSDVVRTTKRQPFSKELRKQLKRASGSKEAFKRLERTINDEIRGRLGNIFDVLERGCGGRLWRAFGAGGRGLCVGRVGVCAVPGFAWVLPLSGVRRGVGAVCFAFVSSCSALLLRLLWLCLRSAGFPLLAVGLLSGCVAGVLALCLSPLPCPAVLLLGCFLGLFAGFFLVPEIFRISGFLGFGRVQKLPFHCDFMD